MRQIDLKCPSCGTTVIDHFQRTSSEPLPRCTKVLEPRDYAAGDNPYLVTCGAVMERVYLPTHRGTVIGDECDVWVKHGICNADGTPRRYTSKTDMKREAVKRGMVNHVEHMPARGSDKSKHTDRWV